MSEKPERVTMAFRVVTVSQNANAFGLHGHVLMSRDGEAWEVARSRGPWNDSQWDSGDDIKLPAVMHDGNPVIQWAEVSCEIPRRLPDAPAAVIKSVFP